MHRRRPRAVARGAARPSHHRRQLKVAGRWTGAQPPHAGPGASARRAGWARGAFCRYAPLGSPSPGAVRVPGRGRPGPSNHSTHTPSQPLVTCFPSPLPPPRPRAAPGLGGPERCSLFRPQPTPPLGPPHHPSPHPFCNAALQGVVVYSSHARPQRWHERAGGRKRKGRSPLCPPLGMAAAAHTLKQRDQRMALSLSLFTFPPAAPPLTLSPARAARPLPPAARGPPAVAMGAAVPRAEHATYGPLFPQSLRNRNLHPPPPQYHPRSSQKKCPGRSLPLPPVSPTHPLF